jgi:hypothetical protein
MSRFLLLSFALFVSAQDSQLVAQPFPREFDFAKTKIGDWTVRAETQISWSDEKGKQLPRVEDVNCYGQSDDAVLSVNAAAKLDVILHFRGPDDDGELADITATGDHLWLYIDGERWEYANLPRRSDELLNVNYPAYEQNDEIIIPVWRGFQAVRKSTDDPWTNFDTIVGKVLSAKKLAWGFKSRDWAVVNREHNELPKGWQKARYVINNAYWQEVANWCSRQVASDTARTLPIDLMKHIGQ